MMKMKKMCRIRILLVMVVISLPVQARADLFGGDVLVLTQILINAYSQLMQLKNILQSGQDNLNYLKDINRGVNDSLNLIRTISPNIDPGIYNNWNSVSGAVTGLTSVYGTAVNSNDMVVQQNTDQSAAEAVALNNSVYQYTQSLDVIGEEIKDQSHNVSPGGAAKLTAESMGVMLTLQNQMLRTQATGLKLQAEEIAIQNRKDKDRTRQMIQTANDLNSALANQKPQFQLPRFQ